MWSQRTSMERPESRAILSMCAFFLALFLRARQWGEEGENGCACGESNAQSCVSGTEAILQTMEGNRLTFASLRLWHG